MGLGIGELGDTFISRYTLDIVRETHLESKRGVEQDALRLSRCLGAFDVPGDLLGAELGSSYVQVSVKAITQRSSGAGQDEPVEGAGEASVCAGTVLMRLRGVAGAAAARFVAADTTGTVDERVSLILGVRCWGAGMNATSTLLNHRPTTAGSFTIGPSLAFNVELPSTGSPPESFHMDCIGIGEVSPKNNRVTVTFPGRLPHHAVALIAPALSSAPSTCSTEVQVRCPLARAVTIGRSCVHQRAP